MIQKLLYLSMALMGLSMHLSALGGFGTPDRPYTISSADDLNQVRYSLDTHYVLLNDIDLSGYLSDNGPGNDNGQGWRPIGESWGGGFTGTFDGGGYTIKGLWINRSSEDYAGLFGYISSTGKIQKVGVEIDNSKGGIKGGKYTGGLVGYCMSEIKDCYVTGNIEGSQYVGGLVGWFDSVNAISSSYFQGNVHLNSSSGYAGGLVGHVEKFDAITQSYTTGSVSGVAGSVIGGLAGFVKAYLRLSEVYSSCKLTKPASGICGVLVGKYKYDGIVPSVHGYYLKEADLNKDLWATGSVEGGSDPGVSTKDIDGAISFNVNQMVNRSSFVGFDKSVWTIKEGDSSPYLSWQGDHNIPILIIDSPIPTPSVPDFFQVTIPFVEGVTSVPAAGKHEIGYGQPLDLTIQLSDAYDASEIRVLANGVALEPVQLRAASYSYRIDEVHSFIDLQILGVKKNNPLGITTPSGDILSPRVYTQASLLCIETVEVSETTVYTLDGKMYAQRPVGEGLTQIPLPAGTYVVRIGNESWKIVIKSK